MKVYISADIEGIGGIVHEDQTIPFEPQYEWATKMMVGEVNAAIGGAFDAGADYVLVNDSHDHMRNLRIDELDPRAMLISGNSKPLCMVEGIQEGFDLAMFVGYHAKAGTQKAVINHTYNGPSTTLGLRLNGRPVGESGINGLVVGDFGVPVGLLTGDTSAVAEAHEVLGNLETVAVKEAVGRKAAKIMHPQKSRQLIREAAARAVKRVSEFKLFVLPKPIRIDVDLSTSAKADMACLIPGVDRVSGRTVGFLSDDVMTLFGAYLTILNVACGV